MNYDDFKDKIQSALSSRLTAFVEIEKSQTAIVQHLTEILKEFSVSSDVLVEAIPEDPNTEIVRDVMEDPVKELSFRVEVPLPLPADGVHVQVTKPEKETEPQMAKSSDNSDEAEEERPSEPLDDEILLEEMVRAFVSEPQAVKVVSIEHSANEKQLIIDVATKDRGRIIGREGKIIKTLNFFMSLVGQMRNLRIQVDLKGQERPREMMSEHRGFTSRFVSSSREYR